MHSSVTAIALIQTEHNTHPVWLARRNSSTNAFSFVGGYKKTDESFRDCLNRKVAEELGLVPGGDFVVAESPHSHLEYSEWIEGTQSETAYTIELFPLTLIGDFAEDKIAGDGRNRWLRRSEIQMGCTYDGQSVSGTMSLLFEMAGLFDDPENPSRDP